MTAMTTDLAIVVKDDPLTQAGPAHPVTDGDDLAAQLQTGRERRLGLPRMDPSGEQDVDEPDPRGPDVDQDLPGTGLRDGHLGQLQHVHRLPGSRDLPGQHGRRDLDRIRHGRHLDAHSTLRGRSPRARTGHGTGNTRSPETPHGQPDRVDRCEPAGKP